MDEQKKSFLNTPVFSKEKGAWGHLLFLDLILFCVELTGYLTGEYKWSSTLPGFIVCIAVIVVYLLSRLIAYRTNVFPKIENREGLHGVSFFILFIIAVVLTFIFV